MAVDFSGRNIMKINSICGELLAREHRASKTTKETETGFKGVLDQQIKMVPPPGEVSPAFVCDARTTVIAQGDKLLSLLDDYVADLENPGKTLKQIAPLVNSIENEVCRIHETVADSPMVDEDLVSLMDELKMTADVAMYKFHRGDFL